MWYIFMFPTSGQIGSGYTSGVSHEWILKAYLSTSGEHKNIPHIHLGLIYTPQSLLLSYI